MEAPPGVDPGSVPRYGGIPVANVWFMLLYAWDRLDRFEQWRAAAEQAPTLDALLARVLAESMDQRLRMGLGREYVRVESVLRGVRGRIDVNKSIRERRFERGQAACRYQAFEVDAPRNQIVKSVLERLVRVGDFGDGTETLALRAHLRRLTRDLHEITTVDVTPEMIRRQTLGRNDGDYRLMLAICELILTSLLPTEQAGTRQLPRWNHDQTALQRLFEAFVPKFFQRHAEGWSIGTQRRWSWPAASPLLPIMIPDVVMDHLHTNQRVVLDTKFASESLRGRFEDAQRFASGHLYQLYAYLRTQEEASESARHATGVLLYPSVGRRLLEQMEIQGHRVVIATVDLGAHWGAIEHELLEVFAIASA